MTDELPSYQFTLQHLSLLHHFKSGMFDDLNMGKEQAIYETVIQRALRVPFLMDQVLAISAAHLSTIHSNEALHYRNQAAQLQTRALAQLNRNTVAIASHHSVDMFLYASFLGLHAMFDALRHRDLENMLDGLITYFGIHRGVLAFAHQSWQDIQPVLNLIVGDRSIFDQVPHSQNLRHGVCTPLIDVIDGSGFATADKKTCRVVIQSLQRTFDLSDATSEPHTKVHLATAFATRLPAAFLDMLRRNAPEALAILAYYAVLVHRSRQFWVFGGSGQFLIRSITANLPSWSDTLRWPNQQIDLDCM